MIPHFQQAAYCFLQQLHKKCDLKSRFQGLRIAFRMFSNVSQKMQAQGRVFCSCIWVIILNEGKCRSFLHLLSLFLPHVFLTHSYLNHIPLIKHHFSPIYLQQPSPNSFPHLQSEFHDLNSFKNTSKFEFKLQVGYRFIFSYLSIVAKLE